MTTPTPAKDSRERSPAEHVTTAAELERRRDPARMDCVDFLDWLDQADIDALEHFGHAEGKHEPTVIYDTMTRMYIDTSTGRRWTRESDDAWQRMNGTGR